MKNIYKVNEEAVKKIAERVYDNGSTVINRHDLEEMFPELKESEDERIRKALIKFHKSTIDIDGIKGEQILAWLEKQCNKDEEILVLKDQIESLHSAIIALKEAHKIELEKQGEQKPVDEIAKEVCKDKVSAVAFLKSTGIMNEKGELAEQYRQDEHKPACAWSEEDERIYQSIMDDIVQENQLNDEQTNWLTDIKYRYFPQPERSWSKEDEEQVCEILELLEESKKNYIHVGGIENSIRWFKERLKSLRPQTTWKPSDEQMEAIQKALVDLCGKDEHNFITGLYYDLKKLREE